MNSKYGIQNNKMLKGKPMTPNKRFQMGGTMRVQTLRDKNNYDIIPTSMITPFDTRKNKILKIEGQTSKFQPKTPIIGQTRKKQNEMSTQVNTTPLSPQVKACIEY